MVGGVELVVEEYFVRFCKAGRIVLIFGFVLTYGLGLGGGSCF